MYIKSLLVIFLLISLSACSDKSQDFIGTYSIIENDEFKELFKIYKEDGKYYVTSKSRDDWSDEKNLLKTVSRGEINAFLNQDTDRSINAMKTNGFVIFKTPPYWGAAGNKNSYWWGEDSNKNSSGYFVI